MIDSILIAIIDYRAKKRVLKERRKQSWEPCDFQFKHSVEYGFRERRK